MSKFSDLVGKRKEKQQHELTIDQMPSSNHNIQLSPKQNAFANLKKTVTDQSSAVTVGEDTPSTGPSPEVSSPKSFKFNLGKKTEIEQDSPPLVQSKLGAADSMQETAAPTFSEKDAAKDFQSPDQPDQYTDAHIAELKQSLDILKNSIDNKELVADALKHIMISLKKHTFLNNILLPEDCQLMVAGLRESYGVTIAKKQTKKKKRDSTTQDVDEVLDQLADLDMQI